MPDEPETELRTPHQQNQSADLPPFYKFPSDVLEKWVALPDASAVVATLTKRDIDNLLFSLLRNNDAHLAIDQVIVKWSNGDLIGANASLTEFRRLTVDSQNYARRFFSSILAQATGQPWNGE